MVTQLAGSERSSLLSLAQERKKNKSQVKAEMYNSDIDLWFEMPDLNVGRHYHSSCSFSEKAVFVFCGIANQTRKYINSIERYNHVGKKSWTLININHNFSQKDKDVASFREMDKIF